MDLRRKDFMQDGTPEILRLEKTPVRYSVTPLSVPAKSSKRILAQTNTNTGIDFLRVSRRLFEAPLQSTPNHKDKFIPANVNGPDLSPIGSGFSQESQLIPREAHVELTEGFEPLSSFAASKSPILGGSQELCRSSDYETVGMESFVGENRSLFSQRPDVRTYSSKSAKENVKYIRTFRCEPVVPSTPPPLLPVPHINTPRLNRGIMTRIGIPFSFSRYSVPNQRTNANSNVRIEEPVPILERNEISRFGSPIEQDDTHSVIFRGATRISPAASVPIEPNPTRPFPSASYFGVNAQMSQESSSSESSSNECSSNYLIALRNEGVNFRHRGIEKPRKGLVRRRITYKERSAMQQKNAKSNGYTAKFYNLFTRSPRQSTYSYI
ncbi:uncharacterized protein LOC136034498 isoform X2 [Artemia franciscana]|uniref:uncharacterized protein LOC136034498 isoform X2 n=1 Tax=Artemia franciscana TaxID=6661 RepID=UPI0032DBB5AF